MAKANDVPRIKDFINGKKKCKLIRAYIPVENEPLQMSTDGDYFYLTEIDAIEALFNKENILEVREDGTLPELDIRSGGIIVLVVIKIDSDEIDQEIPLNMDGMSVNVRLKDYIFDPKTIEQKVISCEYSIPDPVSGYRKIVNIETENIK